MTEDLLFQDQINQAVRTAYAGLDHGAGTPVLISLYIVLGYLFIFIYKNFFFCINYTCDIFYKNCTLICTPTYFHTFFTYRIDLECFHNIFRILRRDGHSLAGIFSPF